MVWPSGHGMVPGMWYGLMGMVWSMGGHGRHGMKKVWPGGHSIHVVCGMA